MNKSLFKKIKTWIGFTLSAYHYFLPIQSTYHIRVNRHDSFNFNRTGIKFLEIRQDYIEGSDFQQKTDSSMDQNICMYQRSVFVRQLSVVSIEVVAKCASQAKCGLLPGFYRSITGFSDSLQTFEKLHTRQTPLASA